MAGFNNTISIIGYENKDLFIRKNRFIPRFGLIAARSRQENSRDRNRSKPTKQIQIRDKKNILLF
jgi:hypothetical protein